MLLRHSSTKEIKSSTQRSILFLLKIDERRPKTNAITPDNFNQVDVAPPGPESTIHHWFLPSSKSGLSLLNRFSTPTTFYLGTLTQPPTSPPLFITTSPIHSSIGTVYSLLPQQTENKLIMFASDSFSPDDHATSDSRSDTRLSLSIYLSIYLSRSPGVHAQK